MFSSELLQVGMNMYSSKDFKIAEIESIEIDGTDYFIAKEFVVKGTTYVNLINENDPLHMMYRNVVVKDGEEFLVGLDSDTEFDLVVAYEQKYIWKDIKKRQKHKNNDDE